MRRIIGLTLVIALSAAALAQQGRKFQIDPQTPEGQLLQKAGRASTDGEKIAVYEEFLATYPGHAGVVFAWNQVQPLLLKAGALDKVISGAALILAAEPDNSPAAYNGLQAEEQKGDAAAIIDWANRTVVAAHKAIESKKPEGDAEAANWAADVDFAKQVILRCEYSFYASALKMNDPASITALYQGLEKLNPQSKYIPMAGPRYFVALLQQNNLAKAREFAEAAAARDQASSDILLFLADASLKAQENDKAAAYAARITATLPAETAPAGPGAAEWEARKRTTLGRAHWISGMASSAKQDWAGTEKAMRAALPLVEGEATLKELLPSTYFFLGMANYSLARGAKPDAARRAEARQYFTLCAATASPYQEQATKNLAAIKAGK